MAFLLIAAIVVAKQNPELIKDLKRRASKVSKQYSRVSSVDQDEGLTPALLSDSARSDSIVKGQLEASVLSLVGEDGRRLRIFGASADEERRLGEWEIESGEGLGEMERATNGLPQLSEQGSVVGKSQVASSNNIIRFSVFEEQPECLQLCLNVTRLQDGVQERHIAVANVRVSGAIAFKKDIVKTPLIVDGLNQQVGLLEVELAYKPNWSGTRAYEEEHVYDPYGSLPELPSSTARSSSPMDLPRAPSGSKKSWKLGFSRNKRSSPSSSSDNRYSAYL